MKFYYGVNPEEKREKLIKSKAAKPFVDEIKNCGRCDFKQNSFP